MVVAKNHRRHGIGRQLLATAEKAAIKAGATHFVLDSRGDAQEFYVNAGCWKTGRAVNHPSGAINYVMVKEVH